jgi:hypothetical protein
MCCGDRFWTVEGSVSLFRDESEARQVLKKEFAMEFSITHHN